MKGNEEDESVESTKPKDPSQEMENMRKKIAELEAENQELKNQRTRSPSEQYGGEEPSKIKSMAKGAAMFAAAWVFLGVMNLIPPPPLGLFLGFLALALFALAKPKIDQKYNEWVNSEPVPPREELQGNSTAKLEDQTVAKAKAKDKAAEGPNEVGHIDVEKVHYKNGDNMRLHRESSRNIPIDSKRITLGEYKAMKNKTNAVPEHERGIELTDFSSRRNATVEENKTPVEENKTPVEENKTPVEKSEFEQDPLGNTISRDRGSIKRFGAG